jgi:hypothetical protein
MGMRVSPSKSSCRLNFSACFAIIYKKIAINSLRAKNLSKRKKMVIVNKKITLVLLLILWHAPTAAQATKPEQKLNYESLYKVHLKWDIEDSNKKLMQLQAQLEKNWQNLQKSKTAPQTEKLRIQQENERIRHEIAQLESERDFSYHLAHTVHANFQWPRSYKGKNPVAGLVWQSKQWARFLLAYLFLPISSSFAAFTARKEWLLKKDNTNQIMALKKSLEENDTILSAIKPLPKNEIALLEAEAGKKAIKIETDIRATELKITELEIEQEKLVHFNEFKANFKPRYMPE